MSPKTHFKLTIATEMPIKWTERKQVWNLSIESHYCDYTVTSVSNPGVKDKMITKIVGMSLLPPYESMQFISYRESEH